VKPIHIGENSQEGGRDERKGTLVSLQPKEVPVLPHPESQEKGRESVPMWAPIRYQEWKEMEAIALTTLRARSQKSRARKGKHSRPS